MNGVARGKTKERYTIYLRLNQRLMAASGSSVMSRLVLKSITWPRQRFSSCVDQPPPVVPVERYNNIGTRKSTTDTITSTDARGAEKPRTITASKATAKAAAIYWPA